MKDIKKSIISLVIRLCGVIVCSMLLPYCNLGTQGTCDCIGIAILYVIICFVAVCYNFNSIPKSTITCVGSIILGLILSILAITTDHMLCAGFLFVVTITSVAIEYVAC